MIGLIGKKIGMTHVFTDDGISLPVTVIEVKKHRVTQIKTKNTDSYDAIQMTTGFKRSNKLLKSEIGHFLKAGVKAGCGLWEFRIFNSKITSFRIGQVFDLSIFLNVKKVDVSGISKGKGFCGTIKRWNFHMQDATHGNSLSHRAPGSIGQNQTPGRVFKGKKMAGHLGNSRTTVQSLNIIKINVIKNLLLVKGSIPGISGGNLIIKPAIKV